jgi:predicted nucleic-acid-binding Zn-ribbon protein
MNVEQKGIQVTCHNCGKQFPVAPATNRDELQQAVALLRKGGGTVRVARWCPWCGETNMVEVPVEVAGTEVVFREVERGLAGLPPRPGEGGRT